MAGKHEKRVFATVLTRDASGRDVLAGMLDYLSNGSEWNLHLLQTPDEVTADAIGKALASEADGFLLTLPGTADAYAALAASRVPVVCVSLRDSTLLERKGPTRFVWNDNAAIGRLAAEHLAAFGGYASFAFLGSLEHAWSRGRELGFRAVVAKAGRSVASLVSPSDAELDIWLRGLQKPAALFAASDDLAARAVAAAGRARIDIPGQLAVLGVDDARRKIGGLGLSSILPGHREMGHAAARILDRLMRGQPVSAEPVTVAPLHVVARASTKRIVPAERVVQLARKYIEESAQDGIGVPDVVAFLNVSRSTLEHRFRERTGHSVREEIEAVRIARAKRLLAEGGGTLGEIAKACGFSSANRLSHVFAQRFGKAPGAFRRGE